MSDTVVAIDQTAPASRPPVPLVPPRKYAVGTILTLRMAGHLRSPVPGQEYWAPAVVLEQYMPNGEISALVWDASAGSHYVASYPVRDVDARPVIQNGLATGATELYEKRSNVGDVLFAPDEFASVKDAVDTLTLAYSRLKSGVERIDSMDKRLVVLESFVSQFGDPSAKVAASESHATGATRTETPKASK